MEYVDLILAVLCLFLVIMACYLEFEGIKANIRLKRIEREMKEKLEELDFKRDLYKSDIFKSDR